MENSARNQNESQQIRTWDAMKVDAAKEACFGALEQKLESVLSRVSLLEVTGAKPSLPDVVVTPLLLAKVNVMISHIKSLPQGTTGR